MDVSTQPQIFFLILRRNEAERKHSAKKNLNLQYFFHTAYIHSACTLPKGLFRTYQLLNLKKELQTTHLIPFFFLSFCIFLLLFQRLRNRASTGLGLRANFCTIFSCAYLPEAPLARACIAHMSTAPLLDWISTSFSHDRNLNA